jgi:hypothetical protein
MPQPNIGLYRNDYAYRALVALVGIGALTPNEAVYLSPAGDSGGDVLKVDGLVGAALGLVAAGPELLTPAQRVFFLEHRDFASLPEAFEVPEDGEPARPGGVGGAPELVEVHRAHVLGARRRGRLPDGCESAPEDVPANLGEINEASRRSAPKPHADLHRAGRDEADGRQVHREKSRKTPLKSPSL